MNRISLHVEITLRPTACEFVTTLLCTKVKVHMFINFNHVSNYAQLQIKYIIEKANVN